jgi:CheY-like chemotaxis protein
MGFIVSMAETGAKAVEIFTETRSISVWCLDLLMPEVDGCEVHELLRLQNPGIMILFACGIFI